MLTDKAGTSSAAVSTEDGQPADSAFIAAHRLDGDVGVMRRVVQLPEGRFLLDELLPGEYRVAAVVTRDDEDTVRTAPLDRCSDRAVIVTVTAGQATYVALKPCVPE